MEIRIKRLRESAKLPSRGSQYAAGYDLYADLDGEVFVAPHSTQKISAGIAVEIPEGYFGGIYARSGLATKEGMRPANCVGVIDADYRGPVTVAIHNDTNEIHTVHPGDRIAQLVIQPFLSVSFTEAEELSETVRGEGGFGSTGMA